MFQAAGAPQQVAGPRGIGCARLCLKPANKDFLWQFYQKNHKKPVTETGPTKWPFILCFLTNSPSEQRKLTLASSSPWVGVDPDLWLPVCLLAHLEVSCISHHLSHLLVALTLSLPSEGIPEE